MTTSGRSVLLRAALDDDLRAPRRARALVSEAIPESHPLARDIELVTSELVANAIEHGAPPCVLEVSIDGGVLRVEVADAGSGEPVVLPDDRTRPRGRGLMVVSRLASAWGVERHRGRGKVTWAEFRS